MANIPADGWHPGPMSSILGRWHDLKRWGDLLPILGLAALCLPRGSPQNGPEDSGYIQQTPPPVQPSVHTSSTAHQSYDKLKLEHHVKYIFQPPLSTFSNAYF